MSSALSPEVLAYQRLHWHDDKTPAVIAGSVLLIFFASLAVCLRLLSRKLIGAPWKADDYTIMVALFFAYGLFGTMIAGAHFGLGKHMVRVGLENTTKMLQGVYALEAIYPWCTASCKISILLLYRRIFTKRNRQFMLACYIVAILILGWAVAGFFALLFQCSPINFFWDHKEGKCFDIQAALTALAIINTLLNVAVLILPMPLVWHLNMPRRQRIATCGVFVLGSLDIVSSIFRTWMMTKVTASLTDVTWHDTDPGMLAFVEPCVGIICACLPTMWCFFRNIKRGKQSSFKLSGGSVDSPPEAKTWPGHGQVGEQLRPSTQGPNGHHREEASFGSKRPHGWMRLEAADDPSVMNKVAQGMPATHAKREQSLPMNVIKVDSDMHWSASNKV
ncbi:MAG: hypothetical protein M1817_004566 [Caeruleum heppii]|nr:MAG: hypothetical protein M1817_004566 [Caeruleum heppii]